MATMNEWMDVSVVVVFMSGCFSVPPKPVFPVGRTPGEKLEIADRYCQNLEVYMNERSGLHAMETGSLIALGLGAILGVSGATAFFMESSADDPSTDSLENRGTLALVGTLSTAIAAGVYAYSSKEISAKKAGSSELAKMRLLVRDEAESLEELATVRDRAKEIPENDSEGRTRSSAVVASLEAEPDKVNVPDRVTSGCYEIALADEDRAQAAVNAVVKDLTAKLRKQRKDKLQMLIQFK